MSVGNYQTLVDAIRARADATPDWPAMVLLFEDGSSETLTIGALWRDALGAASALDNAGLRKGDVAIVAMGHGRRLIATFLGALRLGVVPAMISTPTPRMNLDHYRQRVDSLARDTGAAAVLIRSDEDMSLEDVLASSASRLIVCDAGGSPADAEALPLPSAADAAFMQFTSGTGGSQKAVLHGHAGLMRYLESKEMGHGFGPDDVAVCWTPLYHDQGLLSGLLAPLAIGFRSVLISPLHWVRQPGILLQAMHEYGGTVSYMPNFALNHCVRAVRDREVEGLDLRRWRLLLLGGEPVRAESLRAFAERFAAQGFHAPALRAGYGLAEMVEGVTAGLSGPPNVDWVDRAALQSEQRAVPVEPQSPGALSFVSCGVPKHGAALRIVDIDDGTDLPERRVGEIRVQCSYRMLGYHRQAELTEACFVDGWFRTRDRGYLAAGELYVVGRQSDVILVGGRNLSPEDIETVAERVLGALPGRTVAFGVASEALGTERVVLVCESVDPGDAEQRIALERRLRQALTEALDVTLGELRLVERGWIVKTSSGKKSRRLSREKYGAELAGTAAP